MKSTQALTIASLCLLVGCYTSTKHTTDHTWREQHLLTLAVEEAVKALPLESFGSGTIGIAVHSHVAEAAPFIEASLRARLKEKGLRVSETNKPGESYQILDVLVDAAVAESRDESIEIPIPLPWVGDQLGIPLYERDAAWAWVEYSATITNSMSNEIIARIPKKRGRAYWYAYTYVGFIGPFTRSSLPDDDPILRFRWE